MSLSEGKEGGWVFPSERLFRNPVLCKALCDVSSTSLGPGESQEPCSSALHVSGESCENLVRVLH